MNIIDIILSILLLLGIVRGLYKGFLAELAGLIALIAGIYAAIHFSGFTYAFFSGFLDWDEKFLIILAFATTFFVVAILITLAGGILTRMANLLMLGILNRLLGAVFGFIKMAFLASLFFMFVDYFDVFEVEEETKETSVLYAPVRKIAPLLLPTLIEEIKEGELFESPSNEEGTENES